MSFLLQPEGQHKSQARLIDLFLNAAVYADSGHLDPVLIGPNVNEKEVIANKYQHYPGDEDLQCAPQPEIKLGKLEVSFPFVYENRYVIHLIVSHSLILLLNALP
jgi:hypothetical protein